MQHHLRHWCWCHQGGPPVVGELLDLEELDAQGRPTGRRVRARVETAPADAARSASSTQRLFAVDVPRDPPRMCKTCGHIRLLHPENAAGVAGACSLCNDDKVCAQFVPADPREDP
jgi:hypothetical protein